MHQKLGRVLLLLSALLTTASSAQAEDVIPDASSASVGQKGNTDSVAGSPSAPTHPPTQRGKDDEPGSVVPEGGRIDETGPHRTTDDTIREILRDKRGK